MKFLHLWHGAGIGLLRRRFQGRPTDAGLNRGDITQLPGALSDYTNSQARCHHLRRVHCWADFCVLMVRSWRSGAAIAGHFGPPR